MAQGQAVPITPSVLRWSILESGYSEEDVAKKIKVTKGDLSTWLDGKALPALTQFRKLVALLRRPSATFLLPEPPHSTLPTVSFRRPPGVDRTTLDPKERRYLREAARLQRASAWLTSELELTATAYPHFSVGSNPQDAASSFLSMLSIDDEERASWDNSAQALSSWRNSIEDIGTLVFQFPLGPMACRGFSLWAEIAPAVALNTHWNNEARIFTLLHECGHLLSRTSSACLELPHRRPIEPDPAERWCDRFAAAALLPWESVSRFMRERLSWNQGQKISDLHSAGRIARRFKASLRATVLRLIEHGVSDPTLYDLIPPAIDSKPRRKGGKGRKKWAIVRDQLGSLAPQLLVRAVTSELIDRSTALDYLGLSDSGFSSLQKSLPLE